MFKYVLIFTLSLCCVCHISVAHDEFPEGSIDCGHLSGDELEGYLHGHICKIPNEHPDRASDWVVNWGFFDYDPEIDDPYEKTQENWEKSGCVSTDEDGKKLYDHDCYNQYIREHGLTPTFEKQTDEDPSGKKSTTQGTDGLLGKRTKDVPGPRQLPPGIEGTTDFPPTTDITDIEYSHRTSSQLTITHVTTHTKPYFIKVFVLNNTGRFISTKNFLFVIEDISGEVKYQTMLRGEHTYFTPHGTARKCKAGDAYRNEKGICANNVFAICSYWAAKNWDQKQNPVQFIVGRFHKFGNKVNRYNPDTDIVKILYKNRHMKDPVLVAQFPEPVESEAPAAPMLQKGSMTTKWAALKQR